MKKGKNYLSSVINESITIELSAVDLHHLDCNIENFKKGDLVRVISIPHKLDRYFLVSKLSLNLDDPKSSTLVLGQTFTTLTQNQIKENKAMKDSIVIASKTSTEVTGLREDVKKLDVKIEELNGIVVEIDDEYVSSEFFEDYQKEVNQKLGSVYTVKGSVANYEALMAIVSKQIGDVYNLLDTGANYVYTENGWDKLSETIDLTNYIEKESFEELVKRVEALVN